MFIKSDSGLSEFCVCFPSLVVSEGAEEDPEDHVLRGSWENGFAQEVRVSDGQQVRGGSLLLLADLFKLANLNEMKIVCLKHG